MKVLDTLNILMVEDEDNIGETLKDYLSLKGHIILHARTVREAKDFFYNEKKINVVLMDINLPDGNGISLAKEMRSFRLDFVLLFLSAQNDAETKYKGLELGAEDYITKPFDIRELNIRLSRIFENQEKFKRMKEEIILGSLKIYFSRFFVIDGNGLILNLSQKEISILEILYTNMNEVVSRDDIIEKIWGQDVFPSNRTVDNYIVKLRKWLETDHLNPARINTIRGVGYCFTINPGEKE